MNSEQQSAILDLSLGKIDDVTFCSKYGISRDDVRSEITRLLQLAISTNDSDTVEFALLLGFHFKMLDGTIEFVHELVQQTWHKSHEDMIGLLQKWRDPRSVTPLKNAIQLKPQLDYLEYDDYGAYYKKCLWALVDVGTSEAISVVKECASSDDSVLSEQAAYRLSQLDTEE